GRARERQVQGGRRLAEPPQRGQRERATAVIAHRGQHPLPPVTRVGDERLKDGEGRERAARVGVLEPARERRCEWKPRRLREEARDLELGVVTGGEASEMLEDDRVAD